MLSIYRPVQLGAAGTGTKFSSCAATPYTNMWWFPKFGVPDWGLGFGNPTIWGSILGVPVFVNLHVYTRFEGLALTACESARFALLRLLFNEENRP